MITDKDGKISFENLTDSRTGMPVEIDSPKDVFIEQRMKELRKIGEKGKLAGLILLRMLEK